MLLLAWCGLATAGPGWVTQLGHAGPVRSASHTPDGELVVTSGYRQTKVWDAETGLLLRTIAGGSAALAPDGTEVLVRRFEEGTVHIVDVRTGKERWQLRRQTAWKEQLALGADLFAMATPEGSLDVWDRATGEHRYRVDLPHDPIDVLAVAPDGSTIWVGTDRHQLSVVRASTGTTQKTFAWGVRQSSPWGPGADDRERRNLPGVKNQVLFSETGGGVAVVPAFGGVLWGRLPWPSSSVPDATTRDSRPQPAVGAALSADGDRLMVTYGISAEVWDTRAGKRVFSLAGPWARGIVTGAFSPDGRWLATGNSSGTVAVWDAADGSLRQHFGRRDGTVVDIEISPDSQRVLYVRGSHRTTSAYARASESWVIATGRRHHRFGGLAPETASDSVGALPPHLRDALASVGPAFTTAELDDGWLEVRRRANPSEWVRVGQWGKEDWVVVDHAGRFDARRDQGRSFSRIVARVIDGAVYGLDDLTRGFYTPGLLQRFVGHGRPDDPLDPPAGASGVAGSTPRSAPPALRVLDDRDVELRLPNEPGDWQARFVGIDVSDRVRAACPRFSPSEPCRFRVDALPAWQPDGGNTFELRVWDASGARMRSARALVPVATPPNLPTTRDLWVLAIGVGSLRDGTEIPFAASDALRVARTLEIRGTTFDTVHSRVLSTRDEGFELRAAGRPDRASVDESLHWLAQAAPEDVVFVYVAGVSESIRDDGRPDIAILLADARGPRDVGDPKRVLTGADLVRALTEVPSVRRFVVLDTCGSEPGSQADLTVPGYRTGRWERGVARLAEGSGAWIVAGVTATRLRHEASWYGVAQLTRDLLGRLDDSTDAAYLLRDLSRRRRSPSPVVWRGPVDFSITRRPLGSRQTVPEGEHRPVVVRSGLSGRFGERLDAALAREAQRATAGFWFWDTEPVERTWQVVGELDADGPWLSFRGTLRRGRAAHRLSFQARDREAVAEGIAREVSRVVTR